MLPAPNQSLKDLNTFGFDVRAKQYFLVNSEEELKDVLKKCYADEILVLGGGSNVLLLNDLNRTVLHINIKGVEVLNQSNNTVIVKAMAGENWHSFVRYCVDRDFGGLENLSLIPGNVGTAPIQNIGAYGVELQDSFVECEAIHRQTLQTRTFTKEDCRFGYRDSVFKNELKNQYIITSVTFRLSYRLHQLFTSYGSVEDELKDMGIKYPTILDISNAVINIRQRKLPDPRKLGNAGSFFKNPVITKEHFEEIQKEHPEIKYYSVGNKYFKIPAAWLIDQAGFKGYRVGDAGVHKNQALVLVNYGKAKGKEIFELSEKIRQVIKEEYKIELEREVNVIS